MMQNRRQLLSSLILAPLFWRLAPVHASPGTAQTWAQKLIEAAEAQVGVTVIYDPAYVRLAFPGGDVPEERGVCTDVIIRAFRAAFGFDHQKAVNADMRRSFGAYPKNWGLKRPDPNIDHRRVGNLQAFWKRRGAKLPVPSALGDWQPGDIVTQMLPGNLPHMGILTASRSEESGKLLVAHNIGAGARVEDVLDRYEITGRYRFGPDLFGAG
jgi:uncharacterized protein